jgi:hypothetical protein
MADRAELERRMVQAAEAGEFELAAQLRDELKSLGGLTAFRRETPGAMGLGTDQQVMKPPQGWTPRRRPDPMTQGHKGRGGRKA